MKKVLQDVSWRLCIAAVAAGPVVGYAQSARFNDGIRQGEAQQAQIKTEVQRATLDLTSIINELNRNGIGGEDVKILAKIRDILGDLTAKDMATIIALLQEARNATDPGQFRGDATAAVVKQQAIVVKMRQLLLEYKRQQEMYELSLRFTELAQRQNLNMKEAKSLVRSMQGRAQLDEIQRSSKTLQSGEQESIRDETHNLLAKLLSLAAEADADTADRLRKSVAQAQKGTLEESLRSAVDQLKESKLFLATSAEKNARDRLYELASLVAPVEDTATKLRKAAEKLDKAIAEEKTLMGLTHALPAKAQPNDEGFLKAEDRQADNVDLTDRLRKDLEVIAPTVGDVLKLGQSLMQTARTALNNSQRDPAVTSESQALARLEEARKLLEVQIAKADADKPTGDNLAQTKALREKVAQLRKDQEKLNESTQNATARTTPALSKAEALLQQTAKDLQIETAPESLPAANELSAAARDMDQAQITLDKGTISDAQPPEKSAVNHLVNAEKLLDQQIAKLEHDQEQLKKLEESRDKVAKLIQEEQHVALDTAKEVGKEAARQDASKPAPTTSATLKSDEHKTDPATPENVKPPEAEPPASEDATAKADPKNPVANAKDADTAKQIGDTQSEVGKKTDEARETLPEEGKEAAKPLSQAKGEMNKAEAELKANHSPSAQDPEMQALNHLNKAKDVLDQKIADIQKELGQQPDNSNKLDDVAKALEKAQADLNNAQQKMQKDPLAELAKAQKNIAKELSEKQAKAPKDDSLNEAGTAANKAAEDLARSDVPAAIKQMQKAQDAIEKVAANEPKSENNADPSAKDIGQEQAAIKKAAEDLATAPPAAQQLGNVANDVTAAAADDKGALPAAAKDALKEAESALNSAAAKAAAGATPEASSKTTEAQDAISQAQAAVALALKGMQPGQMADGKGQAAEPGPPGPPMPGAGKTPGEGQPTPNGPPAPGPVNENQVTKGVGDRKDTQANATNSGPRGNAAGASNFTSLPARERQAIQQGQKDKYPQEYGPAVEQYLKNLSDQENK
jgi:hypothetical protein